MFYAKKSKDGKAIWGAILEKAWAKAKGNYLLANEGFVASGIRALTGVPVFSYSGSSFTTTDELTTLHNLAKINDDLGYLAGVNTAAGSSTS